MCSCEKLQEKLNIRGKNRNPNSCTCSVAAAYGQTLVVYPETFPFCVVHLLGNPVTSAFARSLNIPPSRLQSEHIYIPPLSCLGRTGGLLLRLGGLLLLLQLLPQDQAVDGDPGHVRALFPAGHRHLCHHDVPDCGAGDQNPREYENR